MKSVIKLNGFSLRAYGPMACMIYAEGGKNVFTLARAVEAKPPRSFLECVNGYDSLLLIFDQKVDPQDLEPWFIEIATLDFGGVEVCRSFDILVKYGGRDLELLAQSKRLSIEEVIGIHTNATYRVRLLGFAPGFPYLDGLDPILHEPRKATPSPRIEAGSVAIGGHHAGVYSIASPGGWHVLGITDTKLFVPERAKRDIGNWEDSFLLKPGDEVRFIAV